MPKNSYNHNHNKPRLGTRRIIMGSTTKSVVVPTQVQGQNQSKAKAKAPARKALKARKATFTTEVKDGVRIFTPVNKRAKVFTAVLGQKTLANADLKAIRKAGFRTYEYAGGKLKAIKL